MLRKIYQELVLIRKELQAIRNKRESIPAEIQEAVRTVAHDIDVANYEKYKYLIYAAARQDSLV